MNDNAQLLGRVENALSPAAATMFAEQGRDRHFIIELTLSGVALFLLVKYLDGFIDGLGIKELGKKHGKAAVEAARYWLDSVTGKQELDAKELEKHAQEASLTVAALREYQKDPEALARGSATLVGLLEEQGIPKVEAERLSKDIVEAIWQP